MVELYEPSERPTDRTAAAASVAITAEHPLLAASIASALRANGVEVQVADALAAPTGAAVTAEELVVTVALGNGDPGEIHWRVLEHARTFRAAGGRSLILLQDTGGNFTGGPSRGWLGGLAGLARTAALEWPETRVRCIDVAVDADDMAGTAQRLLAAIASAHPVVGVDLSGRVRAVRSGEPLVQPSQRSRPATSSPPPCVWLVSGGARGVTAACTEALARRMPARFALLGRSRATEWPSNIAPTDDIRELRRRLAVRASAVGERPVPSDIDRDARQALAGQEIRDALGTLEAAGVSARYYPCDIRDREQVHGAIARIRDDLGQVTALVHGAGVLDDSLLVNKTRAQLDRVFDTKVGGLQNLLAALDDVPLSHLALFSSAAAFHGNVGQGDYAMANEILNRVAQSLKRRWSGAVVKSFNWGPWSSGMVDPTLARHFEERGIGLIPVREGAALFAEQMLRGDREGVELLVGAPWAR